MIFIKSCQDLSLAGRGFDFSQNLILAKCENDNEFLARIARKARTEKSLYHSTFHLRNLVFFDFCNIAFLLCVRRQLWGGKNVHFRHRLPLHEVSTGLGPKLCRSFTKKNSKLPCILTIFHSRNSRTLILANLRE